MINLNYIFFTLIAILFILFLAIKTLNYPLVGKNNRSHTIISFLFLTIFITVPAYSVKLLLFDFSSLDSFSWLFNPLFVTYCILLGFYSIFMRELSKELFIVQPNSKFSKNFLKTYLSDKIFTKEYINKVLFYIMIMFLVRILFNVLLDIGVYDYILEHIQLIKDLAAYLLLPTVLYMDGPQGNNNPSQGNNNPLQGNGGGAAADI
jgi:hypothetical protein